MSENSKANSKMESMINDYISRTLISQPDLLPLNNDSPLLESGVLDSLSVLKLALFLEEQFGVVVGSEEMVPENFNTIRDICSYIRGKK